MYHGRGRYKKKGGKKQGRQGRKRLGVEETAKRDLGGVDGKGSQGACKVKGDRKERSLG